MQKYQQKTLKIQQQKLDKLQNIPILKEYSLTSSVSNCSCLVHNTIVTAKLANRMQLDAFLSPPHSYGF